MTPAVCLPLSSRVKLCWAVYCVFVNTQILVSSHLLDTATSIIFISLKGMYWLFNEDREEL